ncbi:hypothetical protein NPS53_08870 [Pseudomonas putida]|uniref:hypothetical protein n=1 Tax=Pseudomonas putida TaxID=303 RepID=UPI002364A464|nr:hypothetical protein [Pseudomonas putida]MDD2139686.1 hypothetical protein [Pseudomonas putida]HDS1721610.1 hypothetical protein [Pseudomonas putida]
MTTSRKYIRTEPPALLTEPITFTLDDYGLELFNAYRQARHAYLSRPDGIAPEERGRLGEAHSQAAKSLASYLGFNVRRQLGESAEYDAE